MSSLVTGLRTSQAVNGRRYRPRAATWTTRNPSGHWKNYGFWCQVRGQESREVNGDGKRTRVENETALGDTTDITEDVDPEVKRRVTDVCQSRHILKCLEES